MRKRRQNKAKRFVRRASLLMSILLISLGLFITFEPSTAKSSTGNDYKVIIVQEGDTLWKIAKANNQGDDLRELIYEITQLNKMQDPVIVPGQELIIPININ